MELLRFVIGSLIVLWVVWFAIGGPQSPLVNDPFIEPPPPLGTGETYSITKATNRKTSTDITTDKIPEESFFDDQVSFYGKGNARLSDVSREYIELRASRGNAQPVDISEWSLKSAVTGKSVKIGKGVYLPIAGSLNSEQPILLEPGGRVYILTGRSPKGYSFRINLCTGYFEQFQDFVPRLPYKCPLPRDEDLPTGMNGLTDACFEYIERLRRCEAHTRPLPISFTNDPICQEYVSLNVNYNACVDSHKSDWNFYKNEWRVFLGRNQELWKEKRETILLLDEAGKVVDSVSY